MSSAWGLASDVAARHDVRVQLPAELVTPAHARLAALEEENLLAQRRRLDAIGADAARSAEARLRLRNLGVEEATMTPPEFVCPITQEKMWDPVVASDGHSYERDAIMHVLFRSNGLSPLTREKLRHELFPNVALRKVRAHAGERGERANSLAHTHTHNTHTTRTQHAHNTHTTRTRTQADGDGDGGCATRT